MIAIQRQLPIAFSALCIAVALCAGCSDSGTAQTPTPAPSAQTSEQIERQQAEEARIKAEAEKVERDRERRIERNRTAVDDLMFTGMTVAEANTALGVNGVKGSSIAGAEKEQESYEWKLEGDFTIRATFVNGKLTKKEMVE